MLPASMPPTCMLWTGGPGAATLQPMASNLYDDPERASNAFGERMRELRAREGVSQDSLARESDIHPTSIGRLERGGREPKLTTILRVAHGLGIEPGELVNDLSRKLP
jgi:DNA-binding XRE family transcriptional regulator